MFQELAPFSPISFFSLELPLRKITSKHSFLTDTFSLPSFCKMAAEEEFAKVYAGWNEKGLQFCFSIKQPLGEVFYPEYRKGDAVEIFVNTRQVKQRREFSSFCHHFVFFPEKIEGFYGREISRFRGDSHKLCSPEELEVEIEALPSFYLLSIQIPSHCLYGFDPWQFQKLGFTYQIHRYQKQAQHFAVCSSNFLPEKNPHLWACLSLSNS